MGLIEAQKFVGQLHTINWGKLPGFDRKGATVPTGWENCLVTEVYEMFDGRIVFMSNKTFTPFGVNLLE